MLASTFMDMVLGVDIHFEIVPMSPAPVPLPNPFVGMVFDPAGLLVSQAMSLAAALVSGTAPLGPVLINGFPATTVGTEALNALGVPHIIMPPGVSWAPMPKAPKPAFKGPPPPPGLPVMPEGDAICVFGSPTVTLMGTSAVRLGDMAMSCGEPVRLPSSTVLAVPKGPPVLIGGPPALSIGDALGALLRSKWVAGHLHALVSRLKPQRLRNLLHKGVCFLTGHPVDVATGRVLTDHLDWELPGALPLAFERNYSSAWANREGPLGFGWSHSLDQAVWAERGRVVYLDAEGCEIEFDTFDFPDHVLAPGNTVWEPRSRLTLKALRGNAWEIQTADGQTLHFAAVAGQTGPRKHWSRLVRIESRAGAEIRLDYDRHGCLEWVTDSEGRQVAFEHDRSGRLVAVKLPHPTEAGWLVHTRFAYDKHGDLVQVIDPAGASWRLAYKQHLLIQETNRNGLSFYFAYDGFGEDAYCVRTWGDGGIYDHVIDYDKKGKRTYVTNSLGHTTAYAMNIAGCVTEVIDPLGGATKYEYDELTLAKVKETDAVGGATTWTYDARGNCVKVVGPDGAEVAVEFDAHNQPVRAIDPVKGDWRWGHDERGRLIGRVDSLGRRVQFAWRTEGESAARSDLRRTGSRPVAQTQRRPARLTALIDPAGQETKLGYDGYGNLAALTTPDGATSGWQYDRLGRCVAAVDPNGNRQTREYDVLGRVVRVAEPDGNVRELSYDAEGNVTRARDKQHDVTFQYQGMGRLAARTEAGTTVRFAYDTEEQLIAIANEHGSVYRFQLDAAGRVFVESGFDQVRRQYERDKAGRVTKVFRPDSRQSTYAYDPGGRVTAVEHSDGSTEAYAYRIDGQLLQAKNDTALVTFDRDLLGRIVREIVGEDWVASEYNALGLRVRIQSSKGLDQQIQRNAVGETVGVRAATKGAGTNAPGASGLAAESFEVRFQRDALGLEIARTLPGGVEARWQRDRLGRPVKHEIWSGGEFKGAWQYTWEPSDRLRMIIDALRGPVKYQHDAHGNLAAAAYADGKVDLRMPDAVGNLFRTEARDDRKYGPAGQLLESREPDGRLIKYDYDPEGNLVRKTETAEGGQGEPSVWTYHWNGAGMLAKVVRPDGEEVTFTYDPLGRRLSKTFRARTTRWIWDGNVPLHEWVEALPEPAAPDLPPDETALDELAARRRRAELAARPAQGPPPSEGTASSPITWLFEPESFAPMAKLVGDDRFSIVTDHLGTPKAMFDAAGHQVWSASIDTYGNLRDLEGDRQACPFRWPGQYEDTETGLYYNRFRYYDVSRGGYMSADPIRLIGGLNVFAYATDPARLMDPLGLAACGSQSETVYHTVTKPGAGQGVLNGIDPNFLNPASRFGRAFYVSDDAATTLAELAHHGAQGSHTIRYDFDLGQARVLDLTDPAVAKTWGYNGGPITPATQAIGENAQAAGYNAIKFQSMRGPGTNYAVLNDFDKLLQPQMVVPAP